MDSRIRRLLGAYDRPGAAVAVLRGREPELTRGFGAAHLEDGTPVHAGTNFRLASITKQFTARAIALLADDGRLALNEPVAGALPGLPPWAERVRIGHLVAHTSGVPQLEALIRADFHGQLSDADVARLMAGRADLDFEPGTRFAYNDAAYSLLARVVEERGGRRFGEFLAERIFRPLGMAGTVAHVEGVTTVADRALGYRQEAGRWVDADQGPTTATLGDGGIYSSVRDLARWDAALREPGYQPDPALLAPFAAPGGEGRYGFGWHLDRFRGHRRQRHEGWSTGFQNEIQRFPDAGLTVIVLTNRAAPMVQPLVESIVDLMLEERTP